MPRELTKNVSRIVKTLLASDEFVGKTQGDAATALGVSQPTVSDLLREEPVKGVGLATLISLREYLGRSIDDLLGLPAIDGSPAARSASLRLADAEIERLRKRNEELELKVRAFEEEERTHRAAIVPRATRQRTRAK